MAKAAREADPIKKAVFKERTRNLAFKRSQDPVKRAQSNLKHLIYGRRYNSNLTPEKAQAMRLKLAEAKKEKMKDPAFRK